jgi:multimeric flavodoxin WrbA
MKIIAINGSPRKTGNTATLLQKAMDGATSQKAETELIHLYSLRYCGCVSCFSCKKKGGPYVCAIQDDLTPILERLKTADSIIFGSPIYFMTISSGMSSFLERFLYPYIIYSHEIPTVFPRESPSGFIYTMNAPKEWIEEQGVVLNPYARFAETVLGKKLIPLYAYNTYQFSDYSKYEHDMFDEAEKAEYREGQFPHDCRAAFDMGVQLAEKAKQGS